MSDRELHQASDVLEGGYPLLRFPPELEKQYIRHYEETRLITSGRFVMTGLAVFSLFVILDYIVFPFRSAAAAWCIRAATMALVVLVLLSMKYLFKTKLGFRAVSFLALLINAAVVSIDVIGATTAGYTLTLGSLFVIIASCTLVRFPFWITVMLTGAMAATQFAGMLLFMHLGIVNILDNIFFYGFIIGMMLVSNYSADSDSRRIFLLNIYKKKYEKSGLDKSSAEKYSSMLDEYMRKERPYLNPDLRIEDVSKVLNIKRHHLTQIISEQHGVNFYTYVNRFRVDDARQLLAGGNNEMTVIRIAYETGFNSKSSFNRIFRAMTGVSPSEYKESLCREKN